jgi:uncharacterized membrane protein YuzA (DUF378 family)
MFHSSPIHRFVGILVWLITSIGAINWGLVAAGYNLFDTPFFQQNLANFLVPFQYIVGIAGLISLLMLIDVVARGHRCKC